ncbi:MAG: DUF814 domain-containing protein [Bdellovibrionales bacterium]|nr:DUF814 domain-containing protein [Bdellovibrionales bacterium]
MSQGEFHNQFEALTQDVSDFVGAFKLQAVKAVRFEHAWWLGLDLYPKPGFIWFGQGPSGTLMWAKSQQKLAPSSHPVVLYLKAHFLGQRLTSVEGTAQSLRLNFETPGLRAHLSAGKGHSLELLLEVPERKPYRAQLTLAPIAHEQAPAMDSPRAKAAGAPAPVATPEQKKHAKLLANIQRDIQEAETWLGRFGPLCLRLAADPSLWKNPERLSPEDRALCEEEIAAGRWPSFAAPSTRAALDKIFHERQRRLRRASGGRARLAKMERVGPVSAPQSSRPLAAGGTPDFATPPTKPRKKPGAWVEVLPQLWARVGRSATENDELFRQARDRDLWFHVRGGSGSHVWIPRGQPSFGAKAEASEDMLRVGCQLALINSPAAKSGRAVVDYTERRNLRRIRSAAGKVEILRSETRSVRLDEAFEKLILKRSG